jgi:asparagine synthase (glutamine-hydrolysing)
MKDLKILRIGIAQKDTSSSKDTRRIVVCGITGILSETNRDVIFKMTEVLTHRGPDGEGFYHDDFVSLGQRRLSIIDLEHGQQPISNETDTLQLICNGEIYNSPDLRKELISSGHHFKTNTDVEVILHLYEEYGRDCAARLRGMFAFALWDCEKQTLFLARDHMGQKPLFYYKNGHDFLFASEVKSILSSNMVKPDINLDALWHYISLRFIPDDYTLFRGIQKLPAGTWLFLENDQLDIQSYWELSFENKLPNNEREIEDGLDALLLETVKMHLLSDVRVGAFLSGGIDSSTVSAMMAKVTNEPVPTFSIGVKEQGFNELPYARMVVDRYGLEAYERVVQADLIHMIPSMIYHMDEPSDPFGVGVYLVSEFASEKVKVVLGGDGGDENFAGYDRYGGQRLVDFYCLLPRWFRKTIMAKLVDHIPESFGYKSLAQKAAWLNHMSFFDDGDRYAQSMSFLRFTNEAKDSLFTESAKSRLVDSDSLSKILAHFGTENVDHLVDKMLYTDLMTRMPDHLLVIADRMSMAHSLESRSPLIDYKVVEYAASIPADLKLKGKNLKYVLKKVAARYLPRELIYRKKQGFGFPIGIWMRTDLRDFLNNLFRESRFIEAGIFDGDCVHNILEEHLTGKRDHNFRLWILLNLEIWYRLYFENEQIDSLREHIDSLMCTSVPQ